MKIQSLIVAAVDSFYFPWLRRFVPVQTFRYGVCGGVNMVLDNILYFIIYHFVLSKDDLFLGFVTLSPEIAAFVITFPFTFVAGLWLAKNVSFSESTVRGRTQSYRYLLVVILNIILKYLGIKFLVVVCRVFPSISNAIMTVVTVVVSYVLQKKFSFKV